MKPRHKSALLFFIRLIIGITFVYSSYHKIQDPAEFAKIIYGYAVFPEFSINIIAIIIPFIELTSGFCLIFGVLPRSAISIINGLLAVFIVLIGFNLLRGHEFDCGCFSTASSMNPKLAAILSLSRDAVLLGAGVYYFLNLPEHTKTRKTSSISF